MFVTKKITCFLLFILITACCYSQEDSCHKDSLLFDKCSFVINEMIEREQIYISNNKFIDSLLSTDKSTCNLILWANLFDEFLKRGLKIDERLPKPEPRNNRFSVNEEKVIDKSNPNEIYNLFKLFTDFKRKFEFQYQAYEDPMFLNTVNDIIRYGRYSYPTVVKNMLLNKYPEINKDKFNKDMRYHSRKN